MHRMRGTGDSRIPVFETPGQGQGAPAEKARPEAPLLQYAELPVGIGRLTRAGTTYFLGDRTLKRTAGRLAVD